MTRARLLLWGQASFFAGLFASIAITRDGFTDNHGLSFYGENGRTFFPYAAGVLCCAWFVWRAGLRAIASLLAINLAFPSNLGTVFYWVHVSSSAALFLVELAVAVELVRRRRALAPLLALQLAAGLTAMFSQLHAIALLSWGIVGYQLAFSALIVLAFADDAELAPAVAGSA
jgi:hypothetical protein